MSGTNVPLKDEHELELLKIKRELKKVKTRLKNQDFRIETLSKAVWSPTRMGQY